MNRKDRFHLAPKVRLSHSSYRELNIKVRQGEILNKIARESNIRTPIELVLKRVASDLSQVIPFLSFRLVLSDLHDLVIHEIQCAYTEDIDKFREYILGAIAKKQVVFLNTKTNPVSIGIPATHSIIPVVRNDKAFGALFLSYPSPSTRLQKSSEFLNQLADQIAVCIENSQLYEEILHAELEKSSLVSELAAGAAHEIRNPLTAIRGFVQILQDYNVDVSKKEEYLPIVIGEIDRIEQIIRELLLLAKPFKHQWVKGSISDLLRNIAVLIESQAHLNDIVLEMQFVQNLPEIYMDPDQLKQVFLNIIQNAIEAMPQGGKLTIKAKHAYGFITVEIKDTGVGIPPESIKQIFYPFFTTKEKDKGTGLGLAISSRIVQGFGGTLEVKSHPGRGSTFIIRLPNAT